MDHQRIDRHFARYHEDREREYHQILIQRGLRPAGSRMEDYRAQASNDIAPAKPASEPVKMRAGELADG